MEQALRERSLSSASVRRKRIQEREEQRQQARKDAKERVLAIQELSDCDSRSGSDGDHPGSNHSREDSCGTSSEYSLSTPNDTPQAMGDKTPSYVDDRKQPLRILVPETPIGGRQQSTSDSEPAPKLQASLATFSDFHYDRYSMIVDSPAELLASPNSDLDEHESLCEVATPVSFSMPRSRPAVVSIVSTKGPNKKRRTSSAASSTLHQVMQRSATMPPELPVRNANRLSQLNQPSGFLASEAAPFEVPDLPSNAMYMIANASRDSLAMSTHSAEPTSTRPKQTRKHSMPLFSAAFRSSHSRMSSIKGLVSPTISSPRLSTNMDVQSRPRTAVADSMSFETVPADLNDPLPPPRHSTTHRPATSYASSSTRNGSVTALPTLPPHGGVRPLHHHQHTPRENSPSPELNPRRKKSFSTLRMRSESISNAIKFVSGSKRNGGGSVRDSRLPFGPSSDAPPVPTRMTDLRMSTDLSSFPSPPPPMPSPREQLRMSVTNANYNPFPTGYSSGPRGMVGLGIRT